MKCSEAIILLSSSHNYCEHTKLRRTEEGGSIVTQMTFSAIKEEGNS